MQRSWMITMQSFLCIALYCIGINFAKSENVNRTTFMNGWSLDNQNDMSRKLSGNQSKDRPNIMIIMADDLGTGDITGRVKTKNIDKLAKKGLTFNNAHATPVCAPSRYSLLSGNYNHRARIPAGIWGMDGHNNFKRGQLSLAKVLRAEGDYKTNVVGKWHLGGRVPPNGNLAPDDKILTSPLHNWTLPLEQGARSLGFESSYITSKGIQGPPYTFFRDDYLSTTKVKNWKKGRYRMPHGQSKINTSGQGSPDWDSTAYNMILVNETEKFLDSVVGSEKPFFSYVALGAVHVPFTPPDKYIDGDRIAGRHPTYHMDMIYEVDKVVGSIVKALEDRKMVENTLIIFTSDNGGQLSTTEGEKYNHYSNIFLRGAK